MAKLIRVMNSYYETIAMVDNVTKALNKIEKYSSCSLSENTKLQAVNKYLNTEKSCIVLNCFGVAFHLELLEGTTKELEWHKQGFNLDQTAKLFK